MNHRRLLLALGVAAIITTNCGTSTATPARGIVTRQVGTAGLLPGYIRGSKDVHAKRVIIFVHGIFGDGTSTWTNSNTNTYFPSLITADTTFEGVDVWVHEFDTPKLRQSYTIDELADHLRRYLNNDNVVANHDEIIFICHSMGGLVARAYLLKYHRDVPSEKVRMLYFYSTPTTGSDLATLGRLASNNPQLTDMRKMTTDDPGVLGVWEAQWTSSPYAQQTLSYCAYELRPTIGMYVVQRESARHLCNTRPDPIGRDHIAIVKPADNTTDESYVAFREAYRDTYERREQSEPTALWNLTSDDYALIRVRNVTQTPYCENTCWSNEILVAPGDLVNFSVYYRNRVLMTAKDARVQLNVPQLPLVGLPITVKLSATNAYPVFGAVGIKTVTPVVLVPVRAWLYDDDPTRERDLPYLQRASQVITREGIRLGDVSGDGERHHLAVQFRCEPVTLAAADAEKAGNMAQALLKTITAATPPERGFDFFHVPEGHLDTNDLGDDARWVSDIADVHNQSAIIAYLWHYNNSDQPLRHLRARLSVVEESTQGATVRVVLRSADSELRVATARLTYRSATTDRPTLVGAWHGPKSVLKSFQRLRDLPNASMIPIATSAPDELDLGDLPPQATLASVLAFEMTAPAEAEPFEHEDELQQTTLNGDKKYPWIFEVSDRTDSRDWRENIDGFRPGNPLRFSFHFHNTGDAIARNVVLHLATDTSGAGFKARGIITADNAPPLTRDVRIRFERATPNIRLYYDRAYVYHDDDDDSRLLDATSILAEGLPLGNLNPGEWGWVTITFRTTPDAEHYGMNCPDEVLVRGTPFEMTMAVDNPTKKPWRDINIHLGINYVLSEAVLTAKLTVAGKEDSRVRVHRLLMSEPGVHLRYRDAQLYTSIVGAPFDARTATGSGVNIGAVEGGGQAFLRITYDVIPSQ